MRQVQKMVKSNRAAPFKTEEKHISDAELQVIQVLWAEAPLTAAEIIRKLKDRVEWSPKTIHTLIGRLAAKGFIETEAGVTPYTYRPVITQDEYAHKKARSLIDRIYNGSFSLMVSHFVKDEKLPPEEIEKLKELLNQQ